MRKKILLVNPVVREWARPNNLPLGIAYIAAVLKREGIEFDIFDDNILRWSDARISKYLDENQYEFVGIGAMCHQYRQVKRWVKLLREHVPGASIVVGGPISVLGRRLISWLGGQNALVVGQSGLFQTVQAAVNVWQGEAEVGFVEFLRAPSAGMVVQGVSPGNIDDIPLPEWSVFHMIDYANAPVGAVNLRKWSDGVAMDPEMPRSMNLLAARGCPFTCKFCAHDFMGAKFRTRSVDNILAEMEALWDRYAIRYFHFSDDSTMARPMWLRSLCGGIAKHSKLKDCTWGCAGRVDAAAQDMLKIMYDSGCRIVGFGVESGSQEMLDVMDKRTTVDEAIKAVRNARRIFGAASYSMIVGTPGENDRTIRESIDFCELTESRPEAVFYCTPIPGAAFYELALERGLIPDEEKYMLSLGENSRQITCNISGQSDEWLVAAKQRLEEAAKQYSAAI